MKSRGLRAGFLLLLCTGSLSAMGAATQTLNPLVTRMPAPSGPVPVECDEGQSPNIPPRVNVAEIQAPEVVPATAVVPPSRNLRAELQSAQAALGRNDRAEFDRHVANAKAIVAGYPAGAEKSAADDLLHTYSDITRVWDAQFAGPFFAAGTPTYAAVSGYRGYADAVADDVLVDSSGNRFYPAAESREFLERIASDRLTRIGVPSTHVARTRRPNTQSHADLDDVSRPLPSIRTRTTGSSRHVPTRAPSTTHTATSIAHPASHPTTAPVHRTRSTDTPAGHAMTPVEPAPTTSTTSSTAMTQTEAPPDVVPTATESSASAQQTATRMDTTPETSKSETTSEQSSRTRSIVLPSILILIGLGVLIVLFRTSK